MRLHREPRLRESTDAGSSIFPIPPLAEATLKLHRAVPLRESVQLLSVRGQFFIIEQLIRFVWLMAPRRAPEAVGVRRKGVDGTMTIPVQSKE